MTNKKIIGVLAAALTLLCLTFPVLASGGHTVVIEKAVNDDRYAAYQIFTGDIKAGSIAWGSGITAEGQKALGQPEALAAEISGSGEALYQKIKPYQAAPTAETKVTSEKATLSDLPEGYYLIYDVTRGSDIHLMSVTGSITVGNKYEAPSVAKKVWVKDDGVHTNSGFHDASDHYIGEHIPFRVVGTLPSDLNRYAAYYYEIKDKASAGIDIDPKSIAVRVGETDVTEGYTLTMAEDGHGFSLAFNNIKALKTNGGKGVRADDTVTVTYDGILNKDAVIGSEGNNNTVVLTYSDNPETGGRGTTPEDPTVVFTYKISGVKTDSDTHKPLAGAQFRVYRQKKEGLLTNALGIIGRDEREYATAEGNVFKGWTDIRDNGTVFTSDENGRFEITGLGQGNYYIEEVKAPEGHQGLERPECVKIDAQMADVDNYLSDGKKMLTALAVEAGGMRVLGDTDTGTVAINVENTMTQQDQSTPTPDEPTPTGTAPTTTPTPSTTTTTPAPSVTAPAPTTQQTPKAATIGPKTGRDGNMTGFAAVGVLLMAAAVIYSLWRRRRSR
ncbi:MAG: isopeptide-forming domain-containing fimbrial protein [Eubacteriaceae bacterium]|nr:isopeptide-forming domain-containing fimbrial protein [Eubacteriaceae bacterium]